jgi:ArsR family transcriptional regulator
MRYEDAKIKGAIIKAMANPVRLMIVDELGHGDKCLCDLIPKFKLDQSTLSRHLSRLKKAGIVSERKDGVRVILHLATPCILEVFNCVASVAKDDLSKRRRALKR